MACSKCVQPGDHPWCAEMLAARAAVVGNFTLADPSWKDDGGDVCVWPGVVCTAVDNVPYREVLKMPVVTACARGHGYSLALQRCAPCAAGLWNGAAAAVRCVPWSLSSCPSWLVLRNGTNSSDSSCRNELVDRICDHPEVLCDDVPKIVSGNLSILYSPLLLLVFL